MRNLALRGLEALTKQLEEAPAQWDAEDTKAYLELVELLDKGMPSQKVLDRLDALEEACGHLQNWITQKLGVNMAAGQSPYTGVMSRWQQGTRQSEPPG